MVTLFQTVFQGINRLCRLLRLDIGEREVVTRLELNPSSLSDMGEIEERLRLTGAVKAVTCRLRIVGFFPLCDVV